MQLRVINSNSSGNGYALISRDSTLLIECGVHLDKVKAAIDYDLSKVVGCILTHRHGDHFKYHNQFVKAGIDVYASAGTLEGLTGHRYRVMKPMELYKIGDFLVKPFKIEHDCIEPFGFVIFHEECGNTLFLTDSQFSKYRFSGLNNIIIEANYCEDILNDRVWSGRIEPFIANRVRHSHMSIQTCGELLAANDLSAVNNIVLIHLSDGNSDARKFKTLISNQTGKSVTIADNGTSIDLSKTPF